MIEQGLVLLVQGDATVVGISPTGGFLAQLPKDFSLPSWIYEVVSDPTDYELQGPVSQSSTRIQLKCIGASGAQAISLAKAINDVLSGYHGTLTDADSTVVHGIFKTNSIDFFDDNARNYIRILEYLVCFDSS
jgi:hypothetical protein